MENCLLIDDSKVGILEAQFTIKHFYPKCKFLTSENPFKGLALAEKHHESLDCIIIDYNMEGMNGYELVSYLIEFIPPKKIVMCSANIQRIVQEKVKKLGISFVEKRFDDEKFKELEENLKSKS